MLRIQSKEQREKDQREFKGVRQPKAPRHPYHMTVLQLCNCEGLSAATKLNTARLINEDIMCTTECTGDCNMMEEITELMLN